MRLAPNYCIRSLILRLVYQRLPRQKMHSTAWKLVNDYAGESLPTWCVVTKKSAQGATGFMNSHPQNTDTHTWQASLWTAMTAHAERSCQSWSRGCNLPCVDLVADYVGMRRNVSMDGATSSHVVWCHLSDCGLRWRMSLSFATSSLRPLSGVIVLPNRAGDLRSSPTKRHGLRSSFAGPVLPLGLKQSASHQGQRNWTTRAMMMV